jgi:hypothetical protein
MNRVTLHHALRALLVAVVATLAAVASETAPAAHSNAAATAANSTTFQDRVAEEDARAPDISAVVVSNDDAGLLSFEVQFANRAALGPGEELSLWFDTDRNRATGLLGSDRFIELIGGQLTLVDWNSFAEVPATTLAAVPGASTVTIRIGARELGVGTSFGFYVWTDANPEDHDVTDVDTAPDDFFTGWGYDVKAAPPTLSLAALTCTPSPARSAKPLTARTTVKISRGGIAESLPADATVTWTAFVGSTRLKPRGATRQPSGALSATWLVPKASKGKRVRVSVTVIAETVTVTKNQICRIT